MAEIDLKNNRWLVLSCAVNLGLLTRGNNLVTPTHWNPNFNDSPLATTHMTDPVTHICWSEQMSSLAHSSQVTWQSLILVTVLKCTLPTYWAMQDNLARRILHIWLSTNNAHHCMIPLCHVTPASTTAAQGKSKGFDSCEWLSNPP